MAGFQGSSTRHDPHESFSAAIEAERRQIMTSIPGEVVSYDPKTQKATIRPRYEQKFGDKVLKAPDLMEVPVNFPRGGGMIIHKPMKAGDEVMLNFAQRSLDKSGDDASAANGHPGRMHNMSDAVATPGAYSKPKEASNLPSDRMHIGTEDGKSGLQMKPDGTADLVKDGDSIWTVITDFLKVIKDHKHGGVPMDAGDIAKIDALITRAGKMKA